MKFEETIVAPATGNGGAIAVIRVSGAKAAEICDAVFVSPKGKTIGAAQGYTMLYGQIVNNGNTIDDVVAAIYKAPYSYTGEDMVEISCHASKYIISQITQALCDNGARAAHAGEFTQRAFMNGKLDLAQAEAVADIIASHDKASHYIASQQMRGGYSEELKSLRDKLLRLVSLMELELDFGEEDVEFADRSEFISILNETEDKIKQLTRSFSYGNAIKEGIRVVIAGSPNVGKSTLLNALLKEERAIVSDIAGTTRDVIEDTLRIGGVDFRLTDTAGLRISDEQIEQMGIERTHKAVSQARILLLMFDIRTATKDLIDKQIAELAPNAEQKICILLNKADVHIEDENISLTQRQMLQTIYPRYTVITLSAKTGIGIESVRQFLEQAGELNDIYNQSVTVSNIRHYQALKRAEERLLAVRNGLESGLPTDLIVEDIRGMLGHLGEITGEITTDEILGQIFSTFCIGK